MNRLIMLCMTVLAAGVALAQSVPPDAPSHTRQTQVAHKPSNVYLSPFRDPAFYIGVGVLTSGVVADVRHSQACQAAHTCFELNRGADTWARRAPEVALFAVGSYGCSLMLADHHKWRWACMALPVAVGLYHWRDATHIYQVTR